MGEDEESEDDDMYCDEFGRSFCTPHKREVCHECCFDFTAVNRIAEESSGLRKPLTRAEELAEEKAYLVTNLRTWELEEITSRSFLPEEYAHAKSRLKAVEQELESLVKSGQATQEEIAEAVHAKREEIDGKELEKQAMVLEWKKANPGKTTMIWGGPETQRYYDKVAAKPPSADTSGVEKRTCGYCKKGSAEKLKQCSRCRSVYYCDVKCQRAAWKGHKQECKPVTPEQKSELKKEKKVKKPLTWSELEAFEGRTAKGEVLEVRVVANESIIRQVFRCKDRVGAMKRIAIYTDSGRLPGFAAGKVLRWKNPRFHWFMDGSSGARIEQEDVPNISISD